MDYRRKLLRNRDIVSFGRRTPRVDILALRTEVAELSAEAPRTSARVVDIRTGAEIAPRGGRRVQR